MMPGPNNVRVIAIRQHIEKGSVASIFIETLHIRLKGQKISVLLFINWYIPSNFNGSNIFGSMEIFLYMVGSSMVMFNHSARPGGKLG